MRTNLMLVASASQVPLAVAIASVSIVSDRHLSRLSCHS